MIESQDELVSFFMKLLLVERTTDRQTIVVETWALEKFFFKMKKARLSHQRKDSIYLRLKGLEISSEN